MMLLVCKHAQVVHAADPRRPEFCAEAFAWASAQSIILMSKGVDAALSAGSHALGLQVLMPVFHEVVDRIPRTTAAFEIFSGSGGISAAVRQQGHVSYTFERLDYSWQDARWP